MSDPKLVGSFPRVAALVALLIIFACTSATCQDKPKNNAVAGPDQAALADVKTRADLKIPPVEKPNEKTPPREPEEENEPGPKLFGRDFFRTAPTEFEPSPDTPVPAEYALGPGDELEIVFSSETGQESTCEVKIDPRGQARIPNVGAVSARGLRLTEFESRLNRLLASKYPSLEARVALRKLRALQVFVAGEVTRPGAYTLSGLSRVFNALYAAGGPNKVGSMRKIRLVRDNKTIAELDVYDYLLTGKRTGDLILQSNDTVFIPVVGPTVAVEGEVRRPAIYEMRGGETLSDVLTMAGGLSPSAYARRIQLNRVEDHEKQMLLDVEAEKVTADDLPKLGVRLQAGDTITVLPVLKDRENRLDIRGMVKRPGEYQWKEGMCVSDLIRAAEGFAEKEVYMQRANIYRLREDNSTEVLAFDLGKAWSGDQNENLVLKPKDRVVIYSLEEASFLDRTVRISGEVVKPGVFERKENMTLRDLVIAAGGALPEAYDVVEIAKASGDSDKTEVRTVSLAKAMKGEKPDDAALQDRDHVSIRQVRSVNRAPKTVRIEGEVKFPGTYALENDNERLSRLIDRAGGLTIDSFPEGTVFVRRAPFVLTPSQTDIASNVEGSMRALAEQIHELELAKYGVSKPQTSQPAPAVPTAETGAEKIAAATGGLTQAVKVAEKSEGEKSTAPADIESRKVEEVTKTARLPIDLRAVVSVPGSEADLALQDGDYINIPRRPVVVSVAGAVVSPSLVFYKEGQGMDYYVQHCGGYAKDADKKEGIVIRANGRVLTKLETKTVELGDIIVIPTKALAPPREKWEKWSEIVKSIGSVALTFYVLGR